MKYNYEFTVRPDPEHNWDQGVVEVFKIMRSRIVFDFTEKDFNAFRTQLFKNGFLIHEIERVPYHDPEIVH